MTKTKDMCFNFRQKDCNPNKTNIDRQCIEIVQQYKYLGTIIDNKLSFNCNVKL